MGLGLVVGLGEAGLMRCFEALLLLLVAGTCCADGDDAVAGGAAHDLRAAALSGDLQLVEQGLADGVAVDAVSEEDGLTALFYAAVGGHGAVVEALLKAGADVDRSDKNGNRPLLMGASMNHTHVVAALLAAGAKVNSPNAKGNTALDVSSTDEVKALLLDHRLITAVVKGDLALVKAALAGGANPECTNREGASAQTLAEGKTPWSGKNVYTDIVAALKAAGSAKKEL